MTEIKMDNERFIDINNDPMTGEIVFEFKEMKNGKAETQGIQRIPVRVIANWSKIMYHELDERIYANEYDDDDGKEA